MYFTFKDEILKYFLNQGIYLDLDSNFKHFIIFLHLKRVYLGDCLMNI